MSKSFLVKYDGYRAERHSIDMGQLGQSLIGLDRITNTGLIVLSQNRLPKPRERFPIQIVAESPKKGSVELVGGIGDFANLTWALPLAAEVFHTAGGELIWRWISAVLLINGGRVKQADPHFLRLAELMEQLNQDGLVRDAQWQATLLEAIDKLRPAAQSVVKPVGSSCNVVQFGPRIGAFETEIDEPTAEIIRAKEPMELSDMQEITLNVDGYTHHNKKLKVAHPLISGRFINADIRDPAFDIRPNAYTDAAATKADITVIAKIATTSDDEIQRIYIMGMA